MLLESLRFASYLAYVPREGGGTLGEQSRSLMQKLKNGTQSGSPPHSIPWGVVSAIIHRGLANDLFSEFFGTDRVLVPVPSSSLHREGSLWVPDDLAHELVDAGLGGRVAHLLERTIAIPKSATSISSERPNAQRHYETMRVRKDLFPAQEILLVDDVVTTGGVMLGSANRLCESYPDSTIRGFAAMRTISQPLSFSSWNAPVTGQITLEANGRCRRNP